MRSPGGRPLARALALSALLVAASWFGMVPPGPALTRAAEYTLATVATYQVRPNDRKAFVSIDVEFRNTTPNPPGQFSVFEVIDIAVHDGARGLRARDGKGALTASLHQRNGVTVASIRPRDGVRYSETEHFAVTYVLPDGASDDVRIRPSVVIFPVWSFGTGGRVEVVLPADYEVLVDGNDLTAKREAGKLHLRSGAVADPTRWLALLTATVPSSYVSVSDSVGLIGGEVPLEVRAWSDDRAWGRRTLRLLADALPMLEREIGLDYPASGPLVATESLPASGGELSEPTVDGTDIAVGFDEPAFTMVHQLAHAWFSAALITERWIREGFASRAAAGVADELHVDLPYAPAQEARDRDADAFPLISWGVGEASADQDRYAYAASWAVVNLLTQRVGVEAMRLAWRRIAGGLDGYKPIDAEPVVGGLPGVAVDSRQLLDQLEAVSGKDLAPIFEEWVFDPATAEMLPARAAARAALADLVSRSGDLGIPDPVRLALAGWRFGDAEAAIADATGWLVARDALLNDIQAAGLTAPDRLRTEYQTGGGSQAARDELEAETAVVAVYAEARMLLEGAPSPIEEVGLLGGEQPAALLAEAQTLFAEGDLVGAGTAATGARDRLRDAEQDGAVRVASAGILALLLLAIVVSQIRRRRRARA